MSEVREAEGNQGNSGFASEWNRLARDEQNGQAPAPQDDEAPRDEPGEEPAGQGGNAPPSNEAAATPAPSEEATDDIWANAPEALRNAFQAERAQRERAEQLVRTNGGRASKAEREAAELRARIAAQPRTPAPQAEAEDQPAEIPEHLRSVREEYAEVAGPLVDEIVQLRRTVDQLARQGASAAEQERARHELELTEHLNEQERLLVEAHSDWQNVVLEPEFVTWVQNGPQFIRDGIARNGNGIVDAAEAAKILDMFKTETGRGNSDDLAARRQRQLEAGRGVPTRSIGATPGSPPDDYTSEWKRLAAEEQRREAAQAARR